ncbi:hypothetical protein LCGC14_1651640, partial [marine sediment metagenome]
KHLAPVAGNAIPGQLFTFKIIL